MSEDGEQVSQSGMTVAPRIGAAGNGRGSPAAIAREPGTAGSEGEARARVVAFYLPQFHPIPENDEWWGRGFTEWRNVIRGRPLFPGHYQPHVPADLGFYDLRVPEVRAAQAELAREAGFSAFCYYHYWFDGRRLLERPFEDVLASGEPDFPFCLCWANERWTRTWDGTSDDLLVDQSYSEADDLAHIRWLARAFEDERYVRVDGKPLFLVYRARSLPDPRATTERWRTEAERLGVGELFLARVESFPDEHDDPTEIGFDAAVEFQPDGINLPPPLKRGQWWDRARRLGLSERVFIERDVFLYEDLVDTALAKPRPPYRRFPGVTPMWDNSPRRPLDGGWVFTGSTPQLYARWLEEVVRRTVADDGAGSLVFVNAWNEWAEGNHLEPCERWGHGYLEATRRALTAFAPGA
jgi:Glycosyltransferase WbsX